MPPVEAVRLFAQARIALLDNRRFEAIDLLDRAVKLDPASFVLHKLLADLYADDADARSIAELQKAASIEPDHLSVQIDLGRQFLAHNDLPNAIDHLRLATQTREYHRDDPAAAEADFLLGRALQQQGYDRAALQMYEQLLGRLQNPRLALRRNPQVAVLLSHPDELAGHIAELYERRRDFAAALSLLRAVAARNPNGFEIRARLVRDTALGGNHSEAVSVAADLVSQFHASRDSLALLREITGSPAAAAGVLAGLTAQRPQDRDLVYALIDTRVAQADLPAARRALGAALERWPDDLRLVHREVDLCRAQRDLPAAAQALIASLARRPDHALELSPLWESLLRPSPSGRLRTVDVQAIRGGAGSASDATRLMLLARAARFDRRDAVERDALRQAIATRPLYPPAWREMLASIWTEEAQTTQQKLEASNHLADDAAKAGGEAGAPGLPDELRAQALLNAQQAQPAAIAFARAARAGDRSPELYLNFATALTDAGDDQGAQSLLEKLIDEHPLAPAPYLELYASHEKRGDSRGADRLLKAWLAADPDSPAAHRLEASRAIRERHVLAAEHILQELLDRHDDDPQVLQAVHDFYAEGNHLDDLIGKLETRFAAEPWNFTLGQVLAGSYLERQNVAQAVRVTDALRASALHDPDLLYFVAGLYSRFGQDQRSEQALREVLKLDPTYAGANNDLGYTLAERGRNLGQAEGLIRRALDAEPDNPSYLDSMGWVLYKRGRFGEALRNLTRAANPAEQADPVVLDHLGDTLYRLGERDQAALHWQQAVHRLAETHDDTSEDRKRLKVELLQKQQQLQAGRAVTVAPVSDGPAINKQQPATSN